MEKITRNQAAKILNVHPQTVSNLVKRGVLSGYMDKIARRFYVSKQDVEKYARAYKTISAEEAAIDMLKKRLEEERQSLREDLNGVCYLRHSKVVDIDAKVVVGIANAIFGGDRDSSIFVDFVSGLDFCSIIRRYGLSGERIRQIVNRKTVEFNERIKNAKDRLLLEHENLQLRKEVSDLRTTREDVEFIKNVLLRVSPNGKLSKFLTANNVFSFAHISTFGRNYIKDIVGRKTYDWLSCLLHEKNLDFADDDDVYSQRLNRLARNEKLTVIVSGSKSVNSIQIAKQYSVDARINNGDIVTIKGEDKHYRVVSCHVFLTPRQTRLSYILYKCSYQNDAGLFEYKLINRTDIFTVNGEKYKI